MKQEEREIMIDQRSDDLYNTIAPHCSSTIDDRWDICNAIAEHYDFTPKVKKLQWDHIEWDIYLANVLIENQIVIVYSVEKDKTYNSFFTYFEIKGISPKQQISSHFSYIDAKYKCEEHHKKLVLSLLEL